MATHEDERREQMGSKARRGQPPHFHIDEDWLALRTEDVIDPALPIVDSHHHLWSRSAPYLVPELVADLRSGHNFRATVYIEADFAYRKSGDRLFASVGEVEFANGVGALFASGYYGECLACAGIVGRADLSQGVASVDVLEKCKACAPDRFRGIRVITMWDPSPGVTQPTYPPPPHLMMDHKFRQAFSKLAALDLSFDVSCYHPQLSELIDLVDAYPDTRVAINHTGGRLSQGPYADAPAEVFRNWRASLAALAERPNVFLKLGGLNMRTAGFSFIDRDVPPRSDELAEAWRPFIEAGIEAFGCDRCMFESNFPPDKAGVSARTLWNAFKRIAERYSASEKADLFAGTAVNFYRLHDVSL